MSAQMQEIDDYLNWFEATNLVEPERTIRRLHESRERAAQPERTRKDSISVYLDALETQFER